MEVDDSEENPRTSIMTERGNNIHEKNKGCSNHKMNTCVVVINLTAIKAVRLCTDGNKTVCGV